MLMMLASVVSLTLVSSCIFPLKSATF